VGERGDTFGIGWYFAGASSTVSPMQRLLLGQSSGNAVEIFYNFQVTPWLNVTPDLQYLTPNATRIAVDSFLYGLRANVQF
jgi:porin